MQPFTASSAVAPAQSQAQEPAREGSLAVGIGWRQPHEADLLQQLPRLGFIEVHSENFFGDGGAALATLEQARALYPVSLHGVGLALGSAAGLDPWHLERLAALVQRIDPVRVSDHACFARAPLRPGGPVHHGSDLLPIAFDEATLRRMVRQVQQVQERLRRPLLVENLSAYLHCTHDQIAEAEFFNRLARDSGCAMLLDVNNLVVNALNRVGDAGALPAVAEFLQRLDPTIVGQIHLAGHARVDGWAIDDHGSRVPEAVWQALALALARCGPVPTLIEWDTDVPPLAVLLHEAQRASAALQRVNVAPAAHAAPAAPRPGPTTPAPDSPTPTDHAADPQALLLAALWTPVGADPPPWPAGTAQAWRSVRPADQGMAADGTPQAGPAAGLGVYRAHARALAARALAAAYPTVAAMVGDEAWAQIARRHWLAAPPERGDLAHWGATLAQALQADECLADWPCLADVARVDWALHRAACAADAPADGPDWAALARVGPDRLRLRPVAGAALCASPWPVVQLVSAHRDGQGWAAAAQALRAGLAETAWVWRPAGGWRPQVRAVSAAEAALWQAVLDGAVLSEALDAAWAADPLWSFEDWLQAAAAQRVLAGIEGIEGMGEGAAPAGPVDPSMAAPAAAIVPDP